MTSDIKTAAQNRASIPLEALRRARPRRVLARAVALLLVLGAGWFAGVKTHEAIDLTQVSSMAWTQAATFRSSLEAAATRIASWTASPDERSAGIPERATTAGGEGVLERITGKLEEVRTVSVAAVGDLRGTINTVTSSMESNQRQLVTKLQELSERLDRIERNAPAAATAGLASKLEQLNERLDRIERSAAIVAPPQAPAVATSPTPAARSAAIEAPTSPASSALKLQGPIETKKIPNWVVREVLNGKAILQGPAGIIGVSTGDLVPGVGRVQSIARQGGRWTVATNKGVISAR
jgi:hypothetical protein